MSSRCPRYAAVRCRTHSPSRRKSPTKCGESLTSGGATSWRRSPIRSPTRSCPLRTPLPSQTIWTFPASTCTKVANRCSRVAPIRTITWWCTRHCRPYIPSIPTRRLACEPASIRRWNCPSCSDGSRRTHTHPVSRSSRTSFNSTR
uniref:(northern house mosquito) hypothetical protein n=1 Tax=Culex pipiens TaxID=7175 RepID=A0A8D8PB57_CULPI